MAGTMIHGGQPGFVHTLNGVSLCVNSLDVTINRNVVDARTNCGNSQVAGEVSTEISDSGPVGFGAGSDEATKFAHMIAAAGQAWTMKPSSATTAAGNPQYAGTILGTKFSLKLTPTGNVEQSFSAKLTDSAGYPTRTTAP